MICGSNYIIIKTDHVYTEEYRHSTLKLHTDVTFQPWLHVRTYGEVVQVPLRLSAIPIMQERNGTPSYYEENKFDYRFLKDIPMEVMPGDRIYFHYNTLLAKHNILGFTSQDGKIMIMAKVRYDQVTCAVRDGQIVPIGSYALVDPDMETMDEILAPIYSPIAGPNGEKIPLPKEKWLQTKPMPEAKYLRGYVRYIGEPLIGDKSECKPGQLIYYRKNADWMNMIEGKGYYTIRQRHILGRVE